MGGVAGAISADEVGPLSLSVDLAGAVGLGATPLACALGASRPATLLAKLLPEPVNLTLQCLRAIALKLLALKQGDARPKPVALGGIGLVGKRRKDQTDQ